jgi:F0F1-type ATP synthase membrane subunit b/b'
VNETLKKEVETLTLQLKSQDEKFLRERSELIRQKDAERKRAVDEMQDECERDYQQFITKQQDRLTQTLKTAREGHAKEKVNTGTENRMRGAR